MPGEPFSRIARPDLENLLKTLDVSFVRLSECLVSPGWRLMLNGVDAPGIHYNLAGKGRMMIADFPPIDLAPHTMVIVPRKHPFVLEGAPAGPDWKTAPSELKEPTFDIRKFVAGNSKPQLMLICGYFRAVYGVSIDLFDGVSAPIVEHFNPADRLDQKLKSAMDELVAQEVGAGAMTTALFKQVLITLLRRSLHSLNVWVERFSTLGDPQIARVFASMVARPCEPHCVQSLAQGVGLSRSVFMARFTAAIGSSPMAAIRQLRMRHAATLLSANSLSIDQIANAVGYESRSAFSRAFRKLYGCDPSDYRASFRDPRYSEH